jgi:lipopolysaccharide biosynthesis glycosyltransferase
MKKLVATRADDNNKKINDITIPILKKYADKCGADFQIISDCKNLHMHYRILQFYDLFEEYDSILSIDSDVIVLDRCPNIFEVVPEGKIASIYEDVGTRKEDRRSRIKSVQEKFGGVDWERGYINTGFALFPKKYRFIFEPKSEEELWMGLGYDDIWLGYQINKNKCDFYELSIKYNFMSMFSEPWNNNMSRFEAYVIHYAGNGSFITILSREDNLTQDYLVLKKYGML